MSRAKVIERRERRGKIEKLLLSGVTSQKDIAARLGVSQTTIHRDMVAIEKVWAHRSRKTSEQRRIRRMEQLQQLLIDAKNGWSKSLQDEETISTRTEDGKTVTTRVLRGQSGNPTFLRVMKDCISELAKLEGLHVHKHEHSGPGGGPIEVSVMEEAVQKMTSEELAQFVRATRIFQHAIGRDTVDGFVASNGNGHRPAGGNGTPRAG